VISIIVRVFTGASSTIGHLHGTEQGMRRHLGSQLGPMLDAAVMQVASIRPRDQPCQVVKNRFTLPKKVVGSTSVTLPVSL
jgi:hypothetical protein